MSKSRCSRLPHTPDSQYDSFGSYLYQQSGSFEGSQHLSVSYTNASGTWQYASAYTDALIVGFMAPIPEPGSAATLLLGLAALAIAARARRG